MSFGQLLAESSFVKINANNPIVSGSTNFVPLPVGTVRGRSFSDFVLFFLCPLMLWQLRALHKSTGHTSSLERVPPRRHSRVNRMTPRSLKIHSRPLPAYRGCILDVRSRPRDYGSCALPDNHSTASWLLIKKKALVLGGLPADTVCAYFTSNGTDPCGNGLYPTILFTWRASSIGNCCFVVHSLR